MKYIARTVNGFDTRNKFIRSMDIPHALDVETARRNYENTWFSSTRKQYLNTALKQISDEQLFWPKKVFHDMLEEIEVNAVDCDEKKMHADVDRLQYMFRVWADNRHNKTVTYDALVKEVKSFEAKYRYDCPDSFKSAWMNNGAYITLLYGMKYEGITFPNMTQQQSIDKLRALGIEVVNDYDHNVDERLFAMVHYLYSQKMNII